MSMLNPFEFSEETNEWDRDVNTKDLFPIEEIDLTEEEQTEYYGFSTVSELRRWKAEKITL